VELLQAGLGQFFPTLEGLGSSAFNPEDIPSNNLGAVFGLEQGDCGCAGQLRT
jgi:hypothetical protein